jgi:hypothetical protein
MTHGEKGRNILVIDARCMKSGEKGLQLRDLLVHTAAFPSLHGFHCGNGFHGRLRRDRSIVPFDQSQCLIGIDVSHNSDDGIIGCISFSVILDAVPEREHLKIVVPPDDGPLIRVVIEGDGKELFEKKSVRRIDGSHLTLASDYLPFGLKSFFGELQMLHSFSLKADR